MARNREKVIIGLSGGVDSATAVHFLNEAGFEVIGITLKMLPDRIENVCSAGEGFRVCCSKEAVNEARICALKLGIRHYVVNCSDAFQTGIMDYFTDEYLKGRTPNPCVFCNRVIKFRYLMAYAGLLGARYAATGHYARVEYSKMHSRFLIKKPADESRDQSYMLCMLPPESLGSLALPLGNRTKDEIRKKASELGLIVADKPDSQEICFIPDGEYKKFICENMPAGRSVMKGRIVDASGKELGRHDGIINFTIGQRKGLGITSKEPLFVRSIDAGTGDVVVGSAKEAETSKFRASGLNWFLGRGPDPEKRYTVKIRYKHSGAPATIKPGENGTIELSLSAPERAVTPGQILAIYEDDFLAGGAVIE